MCGNGDAVQLHPFRCAWGTAGAGLECFGGKPWGLLPVNSSLCFHAPAGLHALCRQRSSMNLQSLSYKPLSEGPGRAALVSLSVLLPGSSPLSPSFSDQRFVSLSVDVLLRVTCDVWVMWRAVCSSWVILGRPWERGTDLTP